MDNVAQLIKEIPTLVIYVAPGYLFIWMIWHVTSWKEQSDNHLVFKSIVISYLFIAICDMVTGQKTTECISLKIAIIIASLITGYIVGLLLRKDWLWNALNYIGISQTGTYFFSDIADKKYGIWATVYVPNDKVIYVGQFLKWEERDDSENSYLVLSKYVQYSYDGAEEVNHREDKNYHALINSRDISRIELDYDERSLKLY